MTVFGSAFSLANTVMILAVVVAVVVGITLLVRRVIRACRSSDRDAA